MSRVARLCAVLFIVAVACSPGSRTAAERAQAIEGKVWSPYCPNRLLIDCTTPQARELRDKITTRVERGESDDEILRWIEGDFGDDALARPQSTAVWAIPIALCAVGIVVVVALVRRWTHRPPAQTFTPAPNPRVRKEVEEDL